LGIQQGDSITYVHHFCILLYQLIKFNTFYTQHSFLRRKICLRRGTLLILQEMKIQLSLLGLGIGTASSRGSELNSTVNIVVMRREDKVPTTHLERVELKHDFFENVILSTAAKLASSLKMSSVGDQLQDRFHIYVQDGKRTIRPTKFWSQEFPDATEIDALCRLKLIFVTSDCYVDEEKNFALIADADFVEVVASSSSSSSSSGAADATP
jgi:hypothetical protein